VAHGAVTYTVGGANRYSRRTNLNIHNEAPAAQTHVDFEVEGLFF